MRGKEGRGGNSLKKKSSMKSFRGEKYSHALCGRKGVGEVTMWGILRTKIIKRGAGSLRIDWVTKSKLRAQKRTIQEDTSNKWVQRRNGSNSTIMIEKLVCEVSS